MTRPLDREAVVHDLGEVVLPAEDVLELRGRGPRRVVLAEAQARLDLAGRAARGGDQALAVGLQQLAVHARLEVVALEAGERAEPEEIVHPLRRLAPHRHVGVRAGAGDVVALLIRRSPRHTGLVAAVRARGDVRLEADDGFDPCGARRVVELEGREGVAVVGDGDRRHPVIGRGLGHRGDLRGTVQHGVFAVDMQVHEGVGCHASSLRGSPDTGDRCRDSREGCRCRHGASSTIDTRTIRCSSGTSSGTIEAPAGRETSLSSVISDRSVSSVKVVVLTQSAPVAE
ncbi:hypothetical protein QF046_000115 [Microbacterium sp. W4I4]|nr:hypothetical protein [Microbacterium sp. W4I4]